MHCFIAAQPCPAAPAPAAVQFDVSEHGGSQVLALLAAELEAEQGSGGSGRGAQRGGPGPHGAPWLRDSPGDTQHPSATNTVLSIVTKARGLLEKQQQLEQEARCRWVHLCLYC